MSTGANLEHQFRPASKHCVIFVPTRIFPYRCQVCLSRNKSPVIRFHLKPESISRVSIVRCLNREVPQLASFSHGETATLAFSDVVQLQNFGSLNVIACPFLRDRLWKHSVSCNALDDFSFGFRNSSALITGCCYSWWLHEKFSKFVLRQCCAALQVGNLKEQWICKINDKVHIF